MHSPKVGDLIDMGLSVYYRVSAVSNFRVTAESWKEKKRVFVHRKDMVPDTGKWMLKHGAKIEDNTPKIFSEKEG